MKKVTVWCLVFVLVACNPNKKDNSEDRSEKKEFDQVKYCTEGKTLGEDYIKSLPIWGNTIEINDEQKKAICIWPFNLDRTQEEQYLEFVEGIYNNVDNIYILDETLNTTLQPILDKEERYKDPVLSLIRSRVKEQTITIRDGKIFIDGNEMAYSEILYAYQTDRGGGDIRPINDSAIVINQESGGELRIAFSNLYYNSLLLIKEMDLSDEGYGIRRVYINFNKDE